jgi:hypothetical protein
MEWNQDPLYRQTVIIFAVIGAVLGVMGTLWMFSRGWVGTGVLFWCVAGGVLLGMVVGGFLGSVFVAVREAIYGRPDQIKCPHCRKTVHLPDSYRGLSVKCPRCTGTFIAPLLPPPKTEPHDEDVPGFPDRVTCPQCRHVVLIPDSYRGLSVRCPCCNDTFTAPALSPSNSDRHNGAKPEVSEKGDAEG